ncbi:phage tail protein I [Pseudoalteromonas sp. SCSIO 43201]|uniref:phage tail protein I n=1 Tax=Pseudoalteromonas sp. SCSIO 43201 TaxID=2822842 RepID=UPI002076282F|nr:phage tail protein I [Pseudoalteromonas sp. SCSIO 43201]USD29460.1 phage tail protein I [Pseudoalteromonas sp. SCSIO 43201]
MQEEIFNTLLPHTSTPLEHGLAKALRKVSKTPVPLGSLWDPWRCPEHFLPWLADALSVDFWDSTWPVEVKRKIIANSVPDHRIKGTVSAIKSALSTLAAKVELKEWWQQDNPSDFAPHSAQIIALAAQNLDPAGNTLLTPKLQAQLWQAVVMTKPCRSQISLSVGVQQSASLLVTSASQSLSLQRSWMPQHADNVENMTALVVATTAASHSMAKVSGKVSSDLTSASSIFIQAAPFAIQMQRQQFYCY